MDSGVSQQHGERIAGLEASYQHLATKDDISKLRLELEQRMNQLEVTQENGMNRLQANIDALKWVITLGIGGAAVLLAAIQVVLALALRG